MKYPKKIILEYENHYIEIVDIEMIYLLREGKLKKNIAKIHYKKIDKLIKREIEND